MNKFDERQLWIRGNIFMRIIFYYVVLLLANAWLADNNIFWAGGFYTNLLILITPIAAGSVEMIWRGVYFSHTAKSSAIFMTIMGIVVAIGLTFSIVHIAQGETLVADSILTEEGASLILFLLFLIIVGSSAAKWIIESRRAKKAEN